MSFLSFVVSGRRVVSCADCGWQVYFIDCCVDGDPAELSAGV